MKPINVLSLFDGISCGRVALERAEIKIDNYYASEIKKSAIMVSKDNYPDIKHIGSVLDLNPENFKDIELLTGGSPCQDFSIMKADRLNLKGEKSRLFYEYLRLLKSIKPKYFLLENVKMSKESETQLNKYLGVDGVHINSRLFSYQNRPRIYWTNIPFDKNIADLNVNFQNYKEVIYEVCGAYAVKRTPSREKMWNNGNGRNSKLGGCDNVTNKEKVNCLTRKQDRSPNSGLVAHGDFCRYLTRRELEQAQTLPINYTKAVSYNQAQDVLGDGWTVDVIAHILKGLKNEI